MHWNSGKEKRMSTKPDITWLKDAMGKSKGRALQAIEIYQQCYKDNIERRIKAEIDLHGTTTSKDRMAIRRRIMTEMWKDETEDVVAEITGEVEKQKELKKNQDKDETKVTNENEERSPEEYETLVHRCSCQGKD